ncbi:heterokaryon incompatibility protein-domain-containing protein [Clohesyomyces aquaticus]|uniref:Heterokaryon incompatibility protein-domain-containing protein n=1 Tax=Clohesyomyces aquaticus TaxID=1231657 RepID=A0A1Y1YFM9_9PLEO|nr:heterokaryon incompatibility protein-domain-containing protein [Clohesyomyces aquaticus]
MWSGLHLKLLSPQHRVLLTVQSFATETAWTTKYLPSPLLPPDSKCVRIIDILPVRASASSSRDTIESTFRVIHLSHLRNPPNSPPCRMSGEPFYQSQTAPSATVPLLHLRKKLGAFTIWVDAICINQDDADEKSHQIPLMGDIYSAAGTVYDWLRPGTLQVNHAMEHVATEHFQSYYTTTKDVKLKSRQFVGAWSSSGQRGVAPGLPGLTINQGSPLPPPNYSAAVSQWPPIRRPKLASSRSLIIRPSIFVALGDRSSIYWLPVSRLVIPAIAPLDSFFAV